MGVASGHMAVTRHLQVLVPSLRCHTCRPVFKQDGALDELVDAALTHIENTGHRVTITESSAVTYERAEQEATP
jgi:hypothetical protein